MINANEIKKLAQELDGEFQDLGRFIEVIFIADPRTCYCADCEEFMDELRKLGVKDFYKEYRGNRKTKFFQAVRIAK